MYSREAGRTVCIHRSDTAPRSGCRPPRWRRGVMAANGVRALVRKRAFLSHDLAGFRRRARQSGRRNVPAGRRSGARHHAGQVRDFTTSRSPSFFPHSVVGSVLIADDIARTHSRVSVAPSRAPVHRGKAAITWRAGSVRSCGVPAVLLVPASPASMTFSRAPVVASPIPPIRSFKSPGGVSRLAGAMSKSDGSCDSLCRLAFFTHPCSGGVHGRRLRFRGCYLRERPPVGDAFRLVAHDTKPLISRR